MRFDGFAFALSLKFLPALPLFCVVFVRDIDKKHTHQIKLVKLSALFALVAGGSLLRAHSIL
jgi:hypothetical protein